MHSRTHLLDKLDFHTIRVQRNLGQFVSLRKLLEILILFTALPHGYAEEKS